MFVQQLRLDLFNYSKTTVRHFSVHTALTLAIKHALPTTTGRFEHTAIPAKALSIWNLCRECVWTFHPLELISHSLRQIMIGLFW
jgi:hypothetical protein